MTEWLFENPWPVALALAALGAVACWRAATGGGRRDVAVAATALVLATGALVAGRLVVTPGEQARAVVLALVDRAVAADADGAMALFGADAEFTYVRPENPGLPVVEIRRALDSLERRNRIEANRVTSIEARTLSDDTGEVELHCSTEIVGGMGAVPTGWIVRVRRRDGRWRIDRLTFASLYGKAPSPRAFW